MVRKTPAATPAARAFQANFLLPEFTALENVLLPIRQLGKLDAAAARERAIGLLADLGLSGQADRLPNQLSGGQSQRVAIARGLANDPHIIFADEPTGNLDTGKSHEIMSMLRDFNRRRGITIVVITHEEDIAAYAMRHIRFRDGRIESDDQRRAA